MPESKNVSIVGGGMLGMAISMHLAKMGFNVDLYEASGEPGGLAKGWKIGNTTWDRFYHVILMSDSYTRKMLQEIGLEDQLNWVETKTGFYTDGKLYSMSNTLEFLKFPPLGLIDKFRLGLTIFIASKIKNWKKLENIYVKDWLTKWSGKNTFNKIWLPLLKAKLGDNYARTSAAFIWATIQRMYAARKSGLKKEMFGYVNGGYSTIINQFEKKLNELGVKIHYSHKIETIKKSGRGIQLKFQNGDEVHSEKVLLTIPSTFISLICPELTEKENKKLKSVQYIGVVCASVLLKRPVSPYYVTNITDTWVPFTGVIEMSALVDKKFFNGNSLIYLPKYVEPDNPIFNKEEKELNEFFKKAFLKMYSELNEKDIITIKIAKARNVFTLSTINYSEKIAEMKTSVPGLFITNSSHITNGTLNINETLQLGERVIKEIFNEKD